MESNGDNCRRACLQLTSFVNIYSTNDLTNDKLEHMNKVHNIEFCGGKSKTERVGGWEEKEEMG